jgi:hypothetical protein
MCDGELDMSGEIINASKLLVKSLIYRSLIYRFRD